MYRKWVLFTSLIPFLNAYVYVKYSKLCIHVSGYIYEEILWLFHRVGRYQTASRGKFIFNEAPIGTFNAMPIGLFSLVQSSRSLFPSLRLCSKNSHKILSESCIFNLGLPPLTTLLLHLIRRIVSDPVEAISIYRMNPIKYRWWILCELWKVRETYLILNLYTPLVANKQSHFLFLTLEIKSVFLTID